MSLKKQYLKSKPICKVTFSLSKEEVFNAQKVQVLGEFNDWDAKNAIEMKKYKNGTFKVVMDLPAHAEYQFKYLIDGEKWENDGEADKYVSNGIGAEENSVLIL